MNQKNVSYLSVMWRQRSHLSSHLMSGKLCLNLSLCYFSSTVLKIACLKMTHCSRPLPCPPVSRPPIQAAACSHRTSGGILFFQNFPFIADAFRP